MHSLEQRGAPPALAHGSRTHSTSQLGRSVPDQSAGGKGQAQFVQLDRRAHFRLLSGTTWAFYWEDLRELLYAVWVHISVPGLPGIEQAKL